MPSFSVDNGFWKSPHGRTLPCDFDRRTLLMGIVNATPDSFSDGGNFFNPDAARDQAIKLVSQGADIIDLGAESTRPGSVRIDAGEECRRLIPALRAIREALPEIPVSVDTSRPEVAEIAVLSGADIINDVSAIGEADEVSLSSDYPMGTLAARLGAPLIAMHNRPVANYTDFRNDFFKDLSGGIERILRSGVPVSQLWIDPGFGFGKTPEQNLQLVACLRRIATLGFPVLLGTSRKSTLGIVLGGKPPLERIGGDTACGVLGAFHGAACLRLHDIAAHRDAVKVADALFCAAPDF